MTDRIARVTGKQATHARITLADGREVNLGRVDGPFPWRLWIYKRITFPRMVRKLERTLKEQR